MARVMTSEDRKPEQADGESDESFPDVPAAPGSQSPAGQSAQVADESDDSFPASDPPGNY
jgi:hypothetical protein